jgi:hypothetical protein
MTTPPPTKFLRTPLCVYKYTFQPNGGFKVVGGGIGGSPSAVRN